MTKYQANKISDNVYWVGAIDRDITDFHGYKTSRGTTYNAFLIMGKEPILIDTVKAPFFEEMLQRIQSVIDPKKIKYIISNHSEMDHSGCLPQTIELIKPDKIFASKMGHQALKEHFHFDYSITEVKTGQQLTLGSNNFTFVETRMLHWPDSMFTFYANDGVLFSQDGFGMHLATDKLFAKDNDRDVMRHEAAKYFANILLPYSPLVSKLANDLPSLKLDIQIIAPDHGPLWNTAKDIEWIINLWVNWAKQDWQVKKNKAIIVYDTMWQSTAKLAAAIAEGLLQHKIATKVLPLNEAHRSDVATELLEAGALIVGSPTLNRQMFPTVADVLCYFQGLKAKNLIGQAFGSYGWGKDGIKAVQNKLDEMKVELIAEAVTCKYVPENKDLSLARQLGETIAKQLAGK